MRALLLSCLVLCLSPWVPAQEPATERLPIVTSKRWGIVIGANDYPYMGRLRYAATDAEDVAATLIRDYGFTRDTLRVLTDRRNPSSMPTARNIVATLDKMLADPDLDKNDLFVFYFSGHGVGGKKSDFLLPTDARPSTAESVGLPVQEVVSRLAGKGLRNVLFVADACRAGARNDFGSKLRALTLRTNICLLLGAEPGSRSYEYAGLGHGVFTYYLLEALRKPPASKHLSGAIWASELAGELSAKVERYTKRDYGKDCQKPQAWTDAEKDVLLKLDPNSLPDGDAIKWLVKVRRFGPATYLATLVAFADQLYNRKQFEEAQNILTAITAHAAEDSHVALLFYLLAEKLDRATTAGRIRTAVLQSAAQGRFVDEMLLLGDSGNVPQSRRLAALARRWKEAPWELNFLRAQQLALDGVGAAKLAPFLDRLKLGSAKNRRRSAALGAVVALAARDVAAAIEKYRLAARCQGTVPNQTMLVQNCASLLLKRFRLVETAQLYASAAGRSPRLMLSAATAFFQIRDYKASTQWMQRYLDSGLSAGDALSAFPLSRSNSETADSFETQLARLPSADWRVRVAQAYVEIAKGGSQAKFIEALRVIRQDPAEAPHRFAAVADMALELIESHAAKEFEQSRFQVLLALFALGCSVAQDAGGVDEFWADFIAVAEAGGFYRPAAEIATHYLASPPATQSLSLRAIALPVLIQTGHAFEADGITRALRGTEAEDLALDGAATAAFFSGDDSKADSLMGKLESRHYYARKTSLPPTSVTIRRLMGARARQGAFELDSVEAGFALHRLIRVLAHLEAHKGIPTDDDAVAIGYEPPPTGFPSIYARLFRAIDWSHLGEKHRAFLLAKFLQVTSLWPGVSALMAMPTPGRAAEATDYKLRVESDVTFNCCGDVVPSKASMQIDADGHATGTITLAGEPRLTLAGTVDANGNLRATLTSEKLQLTGVARLWPFGDEELRKLAPPAVFLFVQSNDGGFGVCAIPVKL